MDPLAGAHSRWALTRRTVGSAHVMATALALLKSEHRVLAYFKDAIVSGATRGDLRPTVPMSV